MDSNWGLEKGDTILIQSNIIHTLLHHRCKVKDILDSFLEAVGSEGTLVFPTFSVGFAHGVPFDIRTTKSQVGVLSEFARKYCASVRSGHPMESFVAIGKKAQEFNVNNFSGYGADSPFAILRKMDGKIGILGVPDSKGNSSYHHIEQMNGVTYRHLKEFTELYTDWNGKTEKRTYELFVRDPKGKIRVHVDPCGELMFREGIFKGNRWNEGNGFRVGRAQRMYEFVSDIIKTGRANGLLYKEVEDDGSESLRNN